MDWKEIFVSWGPILLLIVVWVIFMTRLAGDKAPTTKYLSDLLAEQRRHNDLLEKLVVQHDARLRKLEEASRPA